MPVEADGAREEDGAAIVGGVYRTCVTGEDEGVSTFLDAAELPATISDGALDVVTERGTNAPISLRADNANGVTRLAGAVSVSAATRNTCACSSSSRCAGTT